MRRRVRDWAKTFKFFCLSVEWKRLVDLTFGNSEKNALSVAAVASLILTHESETIVRYLEIIYATIEHTIQDVFVPAIVSMAID